jgi:CheY-like chemotaxis protein
MTTGRRKIGEILVANGTISEKTLQRALEKAQRERHRVGEALEIMGVATGAEIAGALAEQFRCKTVRNFADYSYPPELLRLISVDTATRHFLFPLKLEKNLLYLAMADPTDTRVVSILAKNCEVTVVPLIASRGDIIAAVNRHYLGKAGGADKRQTVLIVEDNPVLGSELEKMLSREGYRIIAARDGMEAFKKAISEAPGVIVTDKEMPFFDGYKLLESLKSIPETRRIPVILLTSSPNGREEADAFDRGFFDFLAKPVTEVTLVSRIKRALLAGEGMR